MPRKPVVKKEVRRCFGCDRPLLDLDDNVGYLDDQLFENLSELLYERVKVVLAYPDDNNYCTKCYLKPNDRSFFECSFCKQVQPKKDLAVLVSEQEEQEDLDDESTSLSMCISCLSSVSTIQLISKLQAMRLINSSTSGAKLESDSLYGLFMGAVKIPAPKKDKAK